MIKLTCSVDISLISVLNILPMVEDNLVASIVGFVCCYGSIDSIGVHCSGSFFFFFYLAKTEAHKIRSTVFANAIL